MAELKGALQTENELQGRVDSTAVLEGKMDVPAELKGKLETPRELKGNLEPKNEIHVHIDKSGPKGKDGVSPVVTVEDIENGHRITIIDTKGEQSFDVLNGSGVGGSGVDGKDGEDGATFVPIVSDIGVLSWTNNKGLENPEPVLIKGRDGVDGKDGYTPVKGVDYRDGVDGKDGYTPRKNIDYFDGRDGVDGKDGSNGSDGYTPRKGVDYWTPDDKQEIVDAATNTVEELTPEILQKANQYTDKQIDAIPTPDVSGQINSHNTNTDSHNDIRLVIQALTKKVNDLLDSDDTTLDQMSEIVDYIKANRNLIESVTTTKVNVADIIDNLTTNVSDKPLSAKQGVMLKSLIDAIKMPTKVSELENDKNYLTEHQSLDAYSKTTDMLKLVYPVGAVYISATATDPKMLFGFGTWEQIKEKFLLSAGDSYKVGSTGGSETHSHKYKTGARVYYGMVAGADSDAHMAYDYVQDKWIPAVKDNGQSSLPVKANAGVQSSTKEVSPYFMASEAQVETKSNMPPYFTVYVWKRTT